MSLKRQLINFHQTIKSFYVGLQQQLKNFRLNLTCTVLSLHTVQMNHLSCNDTLAPLCHEHVHKTISCWHERTKAFRRRKLGSFSKQNFLFQSIKEIVPSANSCCARHVPERVGDDDFSQIPVFIVVFVSCCNVVMKRDSVTCISCSHVECMRAFSSKKEKP